MEEQRKTKLAYFWSLMAVAVSILAGIMAVNAMSGLTLIFFGIFNFVFGPICLILYIKEVRKGVFEEEESDDE